MAYPFDEDSLEDEISTMFNEIDGYELEERQRYQVQKELWNDLPVPFADDVPGGLFGCESIDEDLLNEIGNTKLTMKRCEAIRRGDQDISRGEDRDFNDLQCEFPNYLRRNDAVVEAAMGLVNARCAVNQIAPVMLAVPDISTPPGVTGELFPIVVRFVPLFGDVDVAVIRRRLRDFEEEYVLYRRLVTAHEWSFSDLKVNHTRNTTELSSLFLEDDCIMFFRRVLLGKIAKWITDHPDYWTLRVFNVSGGGL